MTEFLVGLDLDGVAYEWDKTARYMLRSHIEAAGARAPTELFFPSTSYSSIEQIVSPADWEWLWTGAITDGLYRYGHVVRGAVEGVRALANLGDVMVVTSRPKAAVNDTIAWLHLMFNQVSLSGIVIQSNGQRKSEVHPTPNVYIDDMPHIADDILSNTESSLIMLTQSWNEWYERDTAWQSAQLRRLVRAANWPQIVRIAEKIREATS